MEYIKKAVGYISDHYNETLDLQSISNYVGVSKYHLSRQFKLFTGSTVFETINVYRCNQAKHDLKKGATVSEAAYRCGFNNLSYFSRTFKNIWVCYLNNIYLKIKV